MFGTPIDGPTSVCCDNEAVHKNVSMPESFLNQKIHGASYHFCRELVAADVGRVTKEDTLTNEGVGKG